MSNDLKYWVALSTNLSIGARTFQKLYSRFESMEAVFKASDKDFQKNKIEAKIVEYVREARLKNPDDEMKKLNLLGIKAITIKDKNYPRVLKELPDAPALLYLKGELKSEDEVAVSVVGARLFTPYGAQVVDKIIPTLCENKVTIISGLALGIDALAHRACLKASGRTIAVLGNGLDHIYPEMNKSLADQIIKSGGVLISEFPIGTPSFKYNFPFRNRIIAGMALGTLVVEAALESGSLITARCALEYNREVFAVPGNIFNEKSVGPNNLIKMGAKPVDSAEDILNELNIESAQNQQKAREISADTKEEAIILGILKKGAIDIDKLIELSKIDVVKINQTIIMMEMKGKIRNLGGCQYVINK